MRHLAIFTPGAVKLIFAGKKKIEGRFSQIKIPPYGKVSANDIVLIKISGKEIVGQFQVDRVIYFDQPTPLELAQIKKKHAKDLALDQSFWLTKEKVKYVTLMFIKSVSKFIIAPQIAKKDLRPWVVLDKNLASGGI